MAVSEGSQWLLMIEDVMSAMSESEYSVAMVIWGVESRWGMTTA